MNLLLSYVYCIGFRKVSKLGWDSVGFKGLIWFLNSLFDFCMSLVKLIDIFGIFLKWE